MKPLKNKALEWIISLYELGYINDKEKIINDNSVYFNLEGYGEHPEIYIRTTDDGLEFGFEATQWDGPIPASVPGVYKKHYLTWGNLQLLNKEEQQEMVLELLMKTINSRKRQYRKCQFCGEKVAVEHRFDKDTCHGCASTNFGVLY
ncbi:hypothetical protein M3649_19275 [Ureibacillus chungkukjangi]|uniref:hypothetical protein n=1 Tax=Ureibacillus chungkukjangi TaxID=1202712 RepID=UPI00203E0F5B|nr:hypothetical protein [Ureibacillus chungkukjangi]MCM3390243.1 hypothetical protein [Ureibacillus chungkukjangi]